MVPRVRDVAIVAESPPREGTGGGESRKLALVVVVREVGALLTIDLASVRGYGKKSESHGRR